MTNVELTRIVRRFLNEEWYPYMEPAIPKDDVPVVTGDWRTDLILHHLNTECGLDITLTRPVNVIESYEVSDEQKFMWFLLRWQ